MNASSEVVFTSAPFWGLNTTSINLGMVVRQRDEYEDFYRMSQFVTGLVLYPILCVIGLIGNTLTLLVLSRGNMRTSTNAFLSALAVSDIVKLLNDLLYFIVIILLKTEPLFANRVYGHLYPYAHFIFNWSACVSSWLTISVALERYTMVCHAARARILCTRKRAIVTSVIVYVVMSLVALPSLFRYKTVRVSDPNSNATQLLVRLTDLWQEKHFSEVYMWTVNLLRSIIPLIVLVVVNTCIIKSLRRIRANKRNSSRNRVTIVMIVVILVFLVCITPDAILSMFLGFGYHEGSLLVKGIREYTDTLLALNAALNFIVYCMFNSIFRRSFAKLFCGQHSPCDRGIEMDETQYRRVYMGSSNTAWGQERKRIQNGDTTDNHAV